MRVLLCVCVSGTKDCAFTFDSDSPLNGTFTSPNYPGLYPRDVRCHYLFYGADKTRVFITFPFFDVDGIPPRYASLRLGRFDCWPVCLSLLILLRRLASTGVLSC